MTANYLNPEFLSDVGLDREQVITLKKAFDAFDMEKKGAISIETTGTILRMMGYKSSPDGFKELIREIDEDGNGELDFEEFVMLSANFLVEEDEEALKKELKDAFRIYSKENPGYIRTESLREILHELDPNLTNEDLNGIISEIDKDNNGKVEFDEFCDLMTG